MRSVEGYILQRGPGDEYVGFFSSMDKALDFAKEQEECNVESLHGLREYTVLKVNSEQPTVPEIVFDGKEEEYQR